MLACSLRPGTRGICVPKWLNQVGIKRKTFLRRQGALVQLQSQPPHTQLSGKSLFSFSQA